jgi:hypothetical protein
MGRDGAEATGLRIYQAGPTESESAGKTHCQAHCRDAPGYLRSSAWGASSTVRRADR